MCDGILYTIRFIDSTTGTNSSYDNKEVRSCHNKISLGLTGTICKSHVSIKSLCFYLFLNQCIHGKSCSQQEEGSFYWHIGFEIEEETSKLLHLKHSFIWCWNLDASGSRSETPGKFWNVVLEKDGEDQLDLSCEKRRSIT